MGMLKFGQTVMRRLHVRSFSSHAAQNEARPRREKLNVRGYANLAVMCAPFYYWFLYRIDFCGVRTLRRAKLAADEESERVVNQYLSRMRREG